MALSPIERYKQALASYSNNPENSGLGSVFAEEGVGRLGKSFQFPTISSPGTAPADIKQRLFEVTGSNDLYESALNKSIKNAAGRVDEPVSVFLPEEPLTGLEEAAAAIKSQAAKGTPMGNLTGEAMVESIQEERPEISAPSPLDEIAEQLKNLTPTPTPQTAEEFRAEEEQRAIAQGRPVSAMLSDDEQEQVASSDPEVVQKALDDTFSGAMDDFINSVRGAGPEKKERTIDDYKREFAEATGVDISGKVDKSSALMAMGLALMQNRAGKGFNVGRMLNAVGKAGEAALPALEKAKERAKAAGLAASKYALESRSSDRAKDEAADLSGKRRGKYWVYKKGGKGEKFSGFDDGEFVDLNPFELNKLIENKDFDSKYEFIDASDRMSILEKRAEGVDLGDAWDSYERVSLIGGKADDVPPELQVLAASASPNYKGISPTQFKLAEKPETIVRRFGELQKSINSGAAQFEDLISAIDSGVSIPDQMVSTVFTGLRNLGFDVGDQPTDITKARTMLKKIAVREATKILQESGKTLSDMDRKRVEQLVGEISFASGDADLIKSKLKEIYDLTVLKPQRNLDRAVSWMEDNAGISFGPSQDDMPTEDELNAINESRKARGEPPLTMDSYK